MVSLRRQDQMATTLLNPVGSQLAEQKTAAELLVEASGWLSLAALSRGCCLEKGPSPVAGLAVWAPANEELVGMC